VASTLKPLLQRVAVVTRWRRAAIVAGCIAGPLFFGVSAIFGRVFIEQWNRSNPGVIDLVTVLQQHAVMNSRWMTNQPHPADRQFEIYIASHYRSVITNDAVWTGAFTISMINAEARRFAEQSLAQHTAPTEEEIKEADAALKKYLPNRARFLKAEGHCG
jgi:hypothetical protein